MTTTLDFDSVLAEFEAAIESERQWRLMPPLLRLWDGDWNLRGRVARVMSVECTEIDGETGMAILELPMDYYISEWVVDVDNRLDNIHLTVDKDGIRWSGRMAEFNVRTEADGTGVLVMTFKHDFEELKHLICYPNPALPPELQFPKQWAVFLPAISGLKLTALVNIMRVESSLWSLPDDPLDPSGWFDFDQSNWSMVVAPGIFDNDQSLPALVVSRMKSLYEASKKICADAQVTWTFRRYLNGDPDPWPGANLRHGCLVIDLVDKSGAYGLTSFFGNLFDGLVKAVIGIDDDGLDAGIDIIDDPNVDPPAPYLDPDFKGTLPEAPWVILRDSPHTGIQTSEFTVQPATDVGVVAGGKSMPYVNELVGAGIEAAGDAIAAAVVIPPIGGSLEQLLRPLYTDCLSGDTLIDGPDGAQRIDSLAVLGAPFRVWSITSTGERVAAMASLAFKKGSAELFELTLEDGRAITVTGQHRFLTENGWTRAQLLHPGDTLAVADHDRIPRAFTRPLTLSQPVPDQDYVGIGEGAAVHHARIVSIESRGEQDFYDLHVPGFENYSAAGGFWNHNTILAFGKWKNINRAQKLGWSHYHEHYAVGDRAYTLGWLLTMRAGMYATSQQVRHEATIVDGAPFLIGAQGYGHFYLGDRVGTTVRGMPPGKIFVNRVVQVTLKWDRDTAPTWTVALGSRENRDPVVRAFEALQETISLIQDLGVL
ncbi:MULTISPECIES: Gp37-like protein [Nocardia]|uniref:Gp37-like protein n=1 Tax=Nocardia TaxID=1817 RepID=UPI000D68FD28|nr:MULTISPECIES: hypothetical protein [Nocardia]